MVYKEHGFKVNAKKPLPKKALPHKKLPSSSSHHTEPLDKTIVVPRIRKTGPLSKTISSATSSTCIPLLHYYKIEDMRQSESAWVLFIRHVSTKQCFVIKILRPYVDTRYNLTQMNERLLCQLEGLYWNRIFTRGIYLGLAHVYELDLIRKVVLLEETIKNPEKDSLNPDADYALVMYQLPPERRLDCLLCEEDKFCGKLYIKVLVKRISEIHGHLAPLSLEERSRWGSYDSLKEKLMHNLELAAPILDTTRASSKKYTSRIQHDFIWLRNALLHAFTHCAYTRYVDQRIQEGYIKRCHGDLKAPNIFMASYNSCSLQEPWQCVWILDAIDFNPLYSNIDVLSDLAMLTIDIQVRLKAPELATLMIDYYLALTGQKDEATKFMLAYYLVEKAFVGAALSFVYDYAPDLGAAFLQIAKMYMERLISMQNNIGVIANQTSLDG